MTQHRTPILTRSAIWADRPDKTADNIQIDVTAAIAEAVDITAAAIIRGRVPLDESDAFSAKYIRATLSFFEASAPPRGSGFDIMMRLSRYAGGPVNRWINRKIPPPEMRLIHRAIAPSAEIYHLYNTGPDRLKIEYFGNLSDLSAHQKLALLERHPSPTDYRRRGSGRSH